MTDSAQRPMAVSEDVFAQNWERIFGTPSKQPMPPQQDVPPRGCGCRNCKSDH